MDPTIAALLGGGLGTVVGGAITFLTRLWQDRLAFRREMAMADRIYLRDLYARATSWAWEVAKVVGHHRKGFGPLDIERLREISVPHLGLNAELMLSSNKEVSGPWMKCCDAVILLVAGIDGPDNAARASAIDEMTTQYGMTVKAMRKHLVTLEIPR